MENDEENAVLQKNQKSRKNQKVDELVVVIKQFVKRKRFQIYTEYLKKLI